MALHDETIQLMTNPRFRGDLLITDRIGIDDLVSKGYRVFYTRKTSM